MYAHASSRSPPLRVAESSRRHCRKPDTWEVPLLPRCSHTGSHTHYIGRLREQLCFPPGYVPSPSSPPELPRRPMSSSHLIPIFLQSPNRGPEAVGTSFCWRHIPGISTHRAKTRNGCPWEFCPFYHHDQDHKGNHNSSSDTDRSLLVSPPISSSLLRIHLAPGSWSPALDLSYSSKHPCHKPIVLFTR